MAKSSKKITITEDHLSAIVREAARDGAHQALAEVGLGDETASGDIKDLRNLIDSWRDNRHIEAMEGLRLDEEKNRISEINETIRAEVVSGDPYVSRMRPTFGYIMAVTWGAQMMAVAYIMIFETSKASVVIEAIESLSGIWAVGLSVLGIYVYKRSDEKKSQQNS